MPSSGRASSSISRVACCLALAALLPGAPSPHAAGFEVQPPVPLPASVVGDLEGGDLDGDGHRDIVALMHVPNEGFVVLLGRGDGTFDLRETVLIPLLTQEASLGDLDGDGDLDLVVTAWDPSATIPQQNPGFLATFLGRGDGTFAGLSLRSLSSAPLDVVVQDLDGDGRSDAALTWVGGAGVTILPGDGDGTFGAERLVEAGAGAARLAVGELNQDPHLDLVFTVPGIAGVPSGYLGALLGRGRPALFKGSLTHEIGSVLAAGIADLDGDTRPDAVALVSRDAGMTSLGTLVVHSGSPSGSLGAGITSLTGELPRGMSLADFDGDGRIDAAVSAGRWVWLQRGRGDGSFDPPDRFELQAVPQRILAGDFDEDGRSDLAVGIFPGAVQILLGQAAR